MNKIAYQTKEKLGTIILIITVFISYIFVRNLIYKATIFILEILV
jgi:hypothetical protein